MACQNSVLERRDSLARVEALRARLGAVHDGVASEELERVVQVLETLRGHLVAAIVDPAEGLHQHRGTEVLVRVPPIRGARRRAARAKDALVHPVELFPIRLRLHVLLRNHLPLLVRRLLQPRLDRLVLVVEVGHVRDEVLQDEHVRQRVDLELRQVIRRVGEACERVHAIDVHRARAADSLTARSPKRERGVHLVLDFNQHVKHHRTALVEINLKRLRRRLRCRVRIVAIDRDLLGGLERRRGGGGQKAKE